MAGHLGEVERDDELADRHHRPGPDEDPAQGRQTEREQREDAGRWRDIAERDRPRAEQPEAAFQLLLVPELGQVGGILSVITGYPRVSAHRLGPFRAGRNREARRTAQFWRGGVRRGRSYGPALPQNEA